MKLYDVYVAGPYSDPDPSVKQERYSKLTEYTALLFLGGNTAYSPITHSHPLTYFGMQSGYVNYKDHDRAFLKAAKELHVLALPNWTESKGVSDEIAFAAYNKIPIFLIDPESFTEILDENGLDLKALKVKIKEGKQRIKKEKTDL